MDNILLVDAGIYKKHGKWAIVVEVPTWVGEEMEKELEEVALMVYIGEDAAQVIIEHPDEFPQVDWP